MSQPTTTPSYDLERIPEQDRDRVAALIQDPRLATDVYIPRHPFGVHEFDLFEDARQLNENILLAGPTGSAKTTVARAYAAHMGLPFTSVEFNGGMDVASVLGHTTMTEDLIRWIDGEVTLLARYGGVILLDECNFAPPRFTAAFHGALDSRRRLTIIDHAETVRLNPHPQYKVLVIAAYNNGDEYVGTTELNAAFKNRFQVPLDWGYDDGVEQILIGDKSQTLLEAGRILRVMEEITTPVSTNSMQEVIKHARRMGIDVAIGLFTNRFDETERPIVTRQFEGLTVTIAQELGVG